MRIASMTENVDHSPRPQITSLCLHSHMLQLGHHVVGFLERLHLGGNGIDIAAVSKRVFQYE